MTGFILIGGGIFMMFVHFKSEYSEKDIISLLSAYFNIKQEDIFLSYELDDTTQVPEKSKIWCNITKRKSRGFYFTLEIYQYDNNLEDEEKNFAEAITEKLKTECLIIPPEENEYGDWLLVKGINNSQIVKEISEGQDEGILIEEVR